MPEKANGRAELDWRGDLFLLPLPASGPLGVVPNEEGSSSTMRVSGEVLGSLE